MHESDTELIKRFLSGDNDALDELVKRHQREAVRIAFAVLSNEQDALDAAQDAFIKVFKNLHRFGGRARFSTWLYRIVYNAATDIARKRRRFVQHKVDEESKMQQAVPDSRDDGNAPEECLLRGEKIACVKGCLEALPFKYRVVVKLKDVEGLSYDDIAQVLGISRGNVMSRLYYGREKLRNMLRRKGK